MNNNYKKYESSDQELTVKIAQRLKKLRTDSRISHDSLSHKLGISVSALKRYEQTYMYNTGFADNLGMSLRNLFSLADFYNVSVDYILGLTDDPAPARSRSAVDALGFAPAVIEWFRWLRARSTADDESGIISDPLLLDRINRLFSNLVFQATVLNLCALYDASAAKYIRDCEISDPEQAEKLRARKLSGYIPGYLKLSEILDGDLAGDLPTEYVYGTSVSVLQAGNARASFECLVQTIQYSAEEIAKEE